MRGVRRGRGLPLWLPACLLLASPSVQSETLGEAGPLPSLPLAGRVSAGSSEVAVPQSEVAVPQSEVAVPQSTVRRHTTASQAVGPQQALLMNPLGLAAGLVLSALVPEMEALYGLNLHYHQVLSQHWALSAVPSASYAEILGIDFYSAAVRLGGRLSFASASLEGWYLAPQFGIGGIWSYRKDNELTRAGSISVGLDAGYLWAWEALVVEAGFGAQVLTYFGHRSFDGSPLGGSVAPLVKLGVGYGW